MVCWVQKTAQMYQSLFLLFVSFWIISCGNHNPEFALPYYNEPDFTPIFIDSPTEVNSIIPHQIGDFYLLNQDSSYVTQFDIEGKIHVANFFFTSCRNICPKMTHNLKTVSDSLSNLDIVFLSYSVTPWIDKPYILNNYKIENDIMDKNWHFLTGTKSDIYTLARKSYFAEEDLGFSKDSTEFLHTEHFILVDHSKRIRGVYNGTLALEMYRLLEDIKTLENEKW